MNKLTKEQMNLTKMSLMVKEEAGLDNTSATIKNEACNPDDLEKKEDMALIFELRQTLPKKYKVAMCHGSRLICDADVYDKKFKLIQVLAHPELPKINSICSFDCEYLLVGTVCYFICMLRWDPDTNVYHYVRRFRLEKSNNGEGDFIFIERIVHM